MESWRGKAVAALLLMLVSSMLHAGTNTWTSLGPTGGEISKIVHHPTKTDIVYLAAPTGFYRSTDSGGSWQLIKEDFLSGVSDIEVDPSRPDRVYVVGNSHEMILVSDDAGITLSRVNSFPLNRGASVLEVSPTGTTLYTMAGISGFRSTDGGASWNACADLPSQNSFQIRIAPSQPQTLFAISSGSQAYVTHDGCDTWSALTLPAGVQGVRAVAVHPTNPQRLWLAAFDGLYLTSNGGASWGKSSPSNDPTAYAMTVEFDHDDASVIYAVMSDEGLVRSMNGGQNWARVNTSPSPVHTVLSIAIRHGQVLLGGYRGVAESIAGDTSWRRNNTGIDGGRVIRFATVPTTNTTYMTVGDEAPYALNAGATRVVPLTAPPQAGSNPIIAEAQAGSEDRLLLPGTFTSYRSIDGGASWNSIGGVLDAWDVVRGSDSQGTIVAGTSSDGVYWSDNFGSSWNRVAMFAPYDWVWALASAPAHNVVYARVRYEPVPPTSSFDRGIYKSVDGGKTWTTTPFDPIEYQIYSMAVSPTNSDVVYGVTNAGPVRSSNGAASWTLLPWSGRNGDDRPLAVVVDPLRPNTVYVAGMYRIARSVDGGSTWQLLRDQPLPTWYPSALAINPARPSDLLLGTQSFGARHFSIQPDVTISAQPVAPAQIGGRTTAKFTVINAGTYHATGIRVQLQAPADATSITATTAGGACTVAGRHIECSHDVLLSGFSHDVELTFRASEGPNSISASVSADQPDPVLANNNVAAPFAVGTVADVSVAVTGPSSVIVGDEASLTMLVRNDGPSTAHNVRISLALGTGLTFVAATPDGICAASVTSVACTLDTLTNGASTTISIRATAASAGTSVSTAQVSAIDLDSVTTNNSGTVQTVVSAVPSQTTPTPTTPPATPTNPPAPSQTTPQSGGGGGGGAFTPWLLVSLLTVNCERRRRAVRRFFYTRTLNDDRS